MTEKITEIVFNEREIADMEKAMQDEPTPQECSTFFVQPDEKTHTIWISPEVTGADLRLDKKHALALVTIIQECIHKW